MGQSEAEESLKMRREKKKLWENSLGKVRSPKTALPMEKENTNPPSKKGSTSIIPYQKRNTKSQGKGGRT